MIVADASVVVVALLSGSGAGAHARERLRLDPDAHAPHLLDVEVAAAVRRMLRDGRTTTPRADSALADLSRLAVLRWEHTALLPRIWALRANLSAYDAAYVALAEALRATLVTADLRLSRAPGIACDVEVLAD